jgi:aspartate/methionine/tyrosine aminotransferase
VAIVPGLDFGPSTAQHYVRISYATSMENLHEAIRRLKDFLASHYPETAITN